jgi:hypothetical protein
MSPYSNYRKPTISDANTNSGPYGHIKQADRAATIKRIQEDRKQRGLPPLEVEGISGSTMPSNDTQSVIDSFNAQRQRLGLASPQDSYDSELMGPPYDGDADYLSIMRSLKNQRDDLQGRQSKIDLIKQRRDHLARALARTPAERAAERAAQLEANKKMFAQFDEYNQKPTDSRVPAERIADHHKDMAKLVDIAPGDKLLDPDFVHPPVQEGTPPQISAIDGSMLSPEDRKNLERNVGVRSNDPNLSPEAVQARVTGRGTPAPVDNDSFRARLVKKEQEAAAAKAKAEAEAVAAASKKTPEASKSMLEYLFHPTSDNNFNYGAVGGLGALGLGGLAYLMSERKNRLRNALLFALIGGGLGVGGKYLADQYSVGMPGASSAPATPTA